MEGGGGGGGSGGYRDVHGQIAWDHGQTLWGGLVPNKCGRVRREERELVICGSVVLGDWVGLDPIGDWISGGRVSRSGFWGVMTSQGVRSDMEGGSFLRGVLLGVVTHDMGRVLRTDLEIARLWRSVC